MHSLPHLHRQRHRIDPFRSRSSRGSITSSHPMTIPRRSRYLGWRCATQPQLRVCPAIRSCVVTRTVFPQEQMQFHVRRFPFLSGDKEATSSSPKCCPASSSGRLERGVQQVGHPWIVPRFNFFELTFTHVPQSHRQRYSAYRSSLSGSISSTISWPNLRPIRLSILICRSPRFYKCSLRPSMEKGAACQKSAHCPSWQTVIDGYTLRLRANIITKPMKPAIRSRPNHAPS